MKGLDLITNKYNYIRHYLLKFRNDWIEIYLLYLSRESLNKKIRQKREEYSRIQNVHSCPTFDDSGNKVGYLTIKYKQLL